MSKRVMNYGRHIIITTLLVVMLCVGQFYSYASTPVVFDIDAAKTLCDSLPLSGPEGIWLYPEDNVAVIILKRSGVSTLTLPEYSITVIETNDVSLHPGDNIGILSATPERNKYQISLFTERHNSLLLKPKTVLAIINEEGESMILKKEKSKFNFRFSLNPYTLLPKTWRIIRMNTTSSNKNDVAPAIGMVKIYPSYDGNGSSRRQVRYL